VRRAPRNLLHFFSSPFLSFFLFVMEAARRGAARKQECRAAALGSREDEKVDAAAATHRYAIS